MKHKLITLLAAVTLATGIGATTTMTTAPQVQAVSKHTWHWHYVRLKKTKLIHRISTKGPRYKWHNIDYLYLEKGSELRIRYFGNDHYFQLNTSDLGEHGTWIVRGSSSSWFKNI